MLFELFVLSRRAFNRSIFAAETLVFLFRVIPYSKRVASPTLKWSEAFPSSRIASLFRSGRRIKFVAQSSRKERNPQDEYSNR